MHWDNATFEMSAGVASQLMSCTKPEIVFSGRSNVGKSSLINRLTGRKALARTSATPGKTATINFYHLSEARLVDLPGYGYARVSGSERQRWSELIEGYFNADRDVRLVIQLLDIRHTPSKDDYQMLDYMVDREIPFIVVLTKSDKINKTERAQRLTAFERELADYDGIFALPFSSSNGEGTEELRSIITETITED